MEFYLPNPGRSDGPGAGTARGRGRCQDNVSNVNDQHVVALPGPSGSSNTTHVPVLPGPSGIAKIGVGKGRNAGVTRPSQQQDILKTESGYGRV